MREIGHPDGMFQDDLKKRKILYNSHGFNYSFSSHKFVFCTLQLVLFIFS